MNEKKVREAIERVKNFPGWNRDDLWLGMEDMEELTETILEALEKQLPKKPIEIDDAYTPKIGEFRVAKCPNCRKEVSDRFDVCLECGQKLDWSE